jgi:hypothetical protein
VLLGASMKNVWISKQKPAPKAKEPRIDTALRMFSLADFSGKNMMHNASNKPNNMAMAANSDLVFPFALRISSICQISKNEGEKKTLLD